MRLKNIIIPATIFILFAGIYLLIGTFSPYKRVVYCPNPACHGHHVEIINAPPGSRSLPNSDWHYFKCRDCQTISAADFSVHNLLVQPVWDIKHYQSIAKHGYETYDCTPGKNWPIGDICGNVGWFPGWPLAIKLLSINHVRFGLIVLPFVFSLLGIILFYNVVLILSHKTVAILSAVALVSTPTAFYLLSGFPYALLLFLFSGYLYYLYSENGYGRKIALPVFAFLISLTYPSGCLTAIIPLILLIKRYRQRVLSPDFSTIVKDTLYYLLPFALGPFVVSLYFYFTFNDFLLFLHFQEKYDRSWDFPLTVIWKSLIQKPTWTPGLFMPPRLTYEKIAIIYYGLIFLIFPPYRIKSELLAYCLLFYLFSPATGTIVSVYRHYLVLFPMAMIIGASPRPYWIKLLYIAGGIILSIGWFYPFFLNGYLV